ncbi:LuxR C-terminal-related transcriptional regulator [Lentzea sp. NPDC051838]|uniref:helix-turn-helix transcriptional regulator n=1 Tax=Lentzea sp. NPDC051838 TaxID=3154849 RepID=UPI003416449C
MIGRTTQLELLGTLLGLTLSGNGQVASVTGPVGTGKTELIHTFAEIASATGLRHLTATCTPSEQALPLGVLSQLLPVSPGSSALDPVQLHTLSTRLVTSDVPLLITVDDIQHADPLSLDCLFYAARRVCGSRVLLLLTEADGPTPLVGALSRERHCHRLRVGVFNVSEASLLAGPRALEVHRLTGGNPLLVHAVLDSSSLREDLLACVHRSHPYVLQTALALAVLGSPDLISDLTGLDPAVVPRVLATMESSGLVLDGALRHPSLAGYLLDALPRHERGDLHLRTARLLFDRGSPASLVAPHLLAADRPLAAWAAPVLQSAASLALQDGASSSAVRYLELATRTATDDSSRASARSRLAAVEWHDSPVTAARHVPALMAAARSSLLDPSESLSLARLLLWHGRNADATTVLGQIAGSPAPGNAETSAARGPRTSAAQMTSAAAARLPKTSAAPSASPTTGVLRAWLYCHLPGHARAMTAHHTHDSGQVPPFPILGSGSDTAIAPAGPPPTEPAPAEPAPAEPAPAEPAPTERPPALPTPALPTPAQPAPRRPTAFEAWAHAAEPWADTPEPHTHAAKPWARAAEPHAHATGPLARATEPWTYTTGPHARAAEPHAHATEPQARAVAPLAHIAEPWARAALTLEAVLRGSQDTTTAEELLQAARTTSVSDHPITALAALVYAGELDRAAEWCDRLIPANRSTTLKALLISVQAEVSLRKGDLTNATKQATQALTTLSHQAWATAIGYPLSTALLAATRAGDQEAHKLAEIPTPPMHETRAGIHYAFARAHHHMTNNRNHAALKDFLLIGETLTHWQMRDIVQWRAGAAEAWLNQGNKAQARALLEDPRTGHELRLRAAVEDKRHRPAILQQAAEDQQDQYELARTLEDLSKAWQAVGEPRRARMTARRAANTAQKTTTYDLSEAERKVARLAARGHTNREIADQLFITASTVEQHLTRVYRKLNVKYRTDLPADIAG